MNRYYDLQLFSKFDDGESIEIELSDTKINAIVEILDLEMMELKDGRVLVSTSSDEILKSKLKSL